MDAPHLLRVMLDSIARERGPDGDGKLHTGLKRCHCEQTSGQDQAAPTLKLRIGQSDRPRRSYAKAAQMPMPGRSTSLLYPSCSFPALHPGRLHCRCTMRP